jgi:hypothetical protein
MIKGCLRSGVENHRCPKMIEVQNKNVWQHTLLHFLAYFKCLLSWLMFHMFQDHGSLSDQNTSWHLVEHTSNILHVPTCCIHVNKGTPHKDIRLTTPFNELFMNMLAVFKCSRINTS